MKSEAKTEGQTATETAPAAQAPAAASESAEVVKLRADVKALGELVAKLAEPKVPPKLDGPPTRASLGRILLYTFGADELGQDGVTELIGRTRPALVVVDHGSRYNVQVFTDHRNDGCSEGQQLHRYSVEIAAEPTPGALHWPPRV